MGLSCSLCGDDLMKLKAGEEVVPPSSGQDVGSCSGDLGQEASSAVAASCFKFWFTVLASLLLINNALGEGKDASPRCETDIIESEMIN